MVPLDALASIPGAVAENPAPPKAALAAAVAGVALLLAPRGLPLRVAGCVLCLPLLLHRAPAPPTLAEQLRRLSKKLSKADARLGTVAQDDLDALTKGLRQTRKAIDKVVRPS